jgi:hypothetical protein
MILSFLIGTRLMRAISSEVVLATLPAASDDERLQVVLTRQPDGSSAISLIQQSWAEGVGWFTQHALKLAPEQVRQLRSVLGAGSIAAISRRAGSLATEATTWDDDPSQRPFAIPFPGRRAESA